MPGANALPVNALPVYAVRPEGLDAVLDELDPATRTFVRAAGFAAHPQSLALLPGDEGLAGALLGLGDDHSPWAFGDLGAQLPPEHAWRLVPGDYDPQMAALGLHLGRYRFTRFKAPRTPLARIDDPASPAEADAVNTARSISRTVSAPVPNASPARNSSGTIRR
jgi:leucyl aminopeptidase